MADATSRAVILNVEEGEEARRAVTRLLQQAGYRVLEAAYGEDVRRLLSAAPRPELAILGVRRPGEAAFELARRLKADPATASVPVVLLATAPAEAALVVAGLESGAEVFLAEPVAARVLLAQVRALLRSRHARDGLAETREEVNQQREQLQMSEQGRASATEELRISGEELAAADVALRASQGDVAQQRALLQGVIDGVPGMVWVKDPEGRFLLTNAQFEELRGTSRARARGRTEEEVFPSPWPAAYRQQERRVLQTGVPEVVEEVIRLPDGDHVFVATTFALYDAEGRAYAVGRIATDTTAQEQAQEALQESSERYRELFESMAEGFVLFDRVTRGPDRPTEWRYLSVNPAYEAMVGLPSSEVVGKLLGEVLPGVEAHWLEALGRVARSGEPETMEAFFSPLGRWYRISFVSRSLGHVAAIITDVTPRKQAEEALQELALEVEARAADRTELQESEARFRDFVTATSDVVYRMSPDWSELRYLRGRDFLPDTEQPTRTWLEKYIQSEDQPRVLAAIHEAIRTKSTFQVEHRVVRVDGSPGWAFSRAIPLLDADGEIVEWFGTASDITARKQAEEALRRSPEEGG